MKTKLLPVMLSVSLTVCSFPAMAGETAPDPSPEDYLVQDALDYVTLGTYLGLEVEKSVYTITEEDLQSELDDRMYSYSYTENVTDRPAASGDTLNVDLKTTADGETETLTDYEIDLGYGILGDEFDEYLLNANVGDVITFSDTFDEDDYMPEWEGKTVDFEVTLNSIGVSVTPELTEEWVKENTEYDTVEEFEESVRADLQAQYDSEAELQAAADVINEGVMQAEFSSLPEDEYQSVFDESLASYQDMADMFGISLEELYETYDLSEEAIADEAEQMVKTQLFLSAVALTEDLTLTREDILDVADRYYEGAGYDTAEDMLEEYGTEGLAPTALEQKIGAFLLEHAVVTEVPYEGETEMFDLEYDEDDDDWDDDDDEWDDDEDDDDGDDDDWEWDEEDDWEEDDEDWDDNDVEWDED